MLRWKERLEWMVFSLMWTSCHVYIEACVANLIYNNRDGLYEKASLISLYFFSYRNSLWLVSSFEWCLFYLGANEREYEKGPCLLITVALSCIQLLVLGRPGLDRGTAWPWGTIFDLFGTNLMAASRVKPSPPHTVGWGLPGLSV